MSKGETKVSASPAEVEKHLSGISFPASRQELISHAKEQNAPSDVMSVLENMPDRKYQDATDVAKGIGSS